MILSMNMSRYFQLAQRRYEKTQRKSSFTCLYLLQQKHRLSDPQPLLNSGLNVFLLTLLCCSYLAVPACKRPSSSSRVGPRLDGRFAATQQLRSSHCLFTPDGPRGCCAARSASDVDDLEPLFFVAIGRPSQTSLSTLVPR